MNFGANVKKIRKKAKLTQAVEDILTYYMNEKPYSGAVSSDNGKTRMQVYRENLHEKRIASEFDLNLMLMRSTRSQKVGRRGVHLTIAGEKVDYYNDELILNHLDESVYCRYDPEDISTVRIYDLNDNYIMTAPTANDTVLAYGSSKEAVGQALRKVKNLEKLTKQELKATAITSLGKKTALELVLAAAEENKAKAEEINLAPAGDYEISFNWGDGVLEDKDKEQAIQLNEVNSGIRKKTDYLKWRYGVDDDQAQEMLPESGGLFGGGGT